MPGGARPFRARPGQTPLDVLILNGSVAGSIRDADDLDKAG